MAHPPRLSPSLKDKGVTRINPRTAAAMFRKEAQLQASAWSELVRAPSTQGASSYMVRFCSSTDRPQVFLELLPLLFSGSADARFWIWLAEKWTHFDLIPHNQFQAAFRQHRNAWSPEFMSPADRAEYDALPERFPAFRGQDKEKPVGLAWTLDRNVAQVFAEGHRGLLNPQPIVIEAMLLKTNVALLLTGRKEAEIVLFAPP